MADASSYFVVPRLSRRVWKVWMRDRDVFMRTIKVNFLPPILEPVLYILALGFGLGIFIKEIGGAPYAVFIAPGLVAITVMNSAFFECTFGSFVRMYYQKTFDAIIATPLSLEEVVAGELLWGATKSLINGSLVLAVVSALGLVSLPLALLIVPFSLAAGFLFAVIAMCFTAISPTIDTFNYPFFLLVTPMFLISGTFFPLSVLPEAIQYLALAALPLTHVVIIVRGLAFGVEWHMLLSLAWIAVVGSILFIVAINLMKKRLII